MKRTIISSFTSFSAFVLLFCASVAAQPRPTDEADYNGTFRYAASGTNSAYPVIFRVESEYFENGKSVRKLTEGVENESEGRHRSKTIELEAGKTKEVQEILLGFGNGFCKEGNGPWKRSEYVCFGPGMIDGGRRTPEKLEYTVEDKKIDGKSVKIYRKFAVFAAEQPSRPKRFEEEIATIDSNGYFLTVDKTFGTVEPRVVFRTTKQSWIVKAKIEPIVPPIK